jgi:hypothetical protein
MTHFRTKEADLIIPALKVLMKWIERQKVVPTNVLSKEIRQELVPTIYDLEPLKNRNDDRLSQVIRNLVSHRTLEKRGYAEYRKDFEFGLSGYVINRRGIEYLSENTNGHFTIDDISIGGQMFLDLKTDG